MLEKLFKNNPLGVLLVAVSIIGAGYVGNYQLSSLLTEFGTFKVDVEKRMDTMEKKINDRLDDTDSAIKALDDKLDKKTEKIQDDISNIRVTVATLEERTKTSPQKG